MTSDVVLSFVVINQVRRVMNVTFFRHVEAFHPATISLAKDGKTTFPFKLHIIRFC